MDFVTHLPDTKAVDTLGRSFNQKAVFVDRYSKMAIIRPCSERITAEEFADLFEQAVVTPHGLPDSVVSDRDSKFTGKFWTSLMPMLQTKLQLSSAFHPQSDGQTERMNRTLGDMLRHYIGNCKLSEWEKLLPAAEFAINNSYSDALGSTPFRVNKGYDPRAPNAMHVASDTFPPAREWAKVRSEGLKDARRHLEAAQQRQRAYYDGKHRAVTYKEGDQVMLITSNLNMNRAGQPNTPRRFLPKWIGPFTVTKQINEVAYRVKLPHHLSRLHDVFHVSKLKPYRHDPERGPITDEQPEEVLVGDNIEFVVQEVLSHKEHKPENRRGSARYEYLVQWRDFKQPTWEPAKNINDCIQYYEYWAKLGRTPPKPKGRPPKHGRWVPEVAPSGDGIDDAAVE